MAACASTLTSLATCEAGAPRTKRPPTAEFLLYCVCESFSKSPCLALPRPVGLLHRECVLRRRRFRPFLHGDVRLNHQRGGHQVRTQVFDAALKAGVWPRGIEAKQFHVAAVLGIEVRGYFKLVDPHRLAAYFTQDCRGAMTPGGGGDSDAAPENPGETVCRKGDAYALRAPTHRGIQSPASHLDIRQIPPPGLCNFCIDRGPQRHAPVFGMREGGFADTKLPKLNRVRMLNVPRATANLASLVQRYQVPGRFVGWMPMASVSRDLGFPNGPVFHIHLCSKSLHTRE